MARDEYCNKKESSHKSHFKTNQSARTKQSNQKYTNGFNIRYEFQITMSNM